MRFTPVPVSGGLTFTKVSSRFPGTTCGLAAGGAAYCWGANYQGQTGNGGAAFEYHSPVPVAGGHTFVDLSAGGSHSCGVDAAGDAWCWGSYGDPNTLIDPVPGGLQWRSISVRAEHSCGITTSDLAYCWGFNGSGQLGDGTTTDSGMDPAPVAGALTFQSIAPAEGYTCGLTLEGVAYCWGEGTSGQLGQNSLDTHLSPAPVVGQP
jgi:alpha-tubulin suppressor-like RCC1 family protein